jgi:hypothetical protein
MKNIEANDQNQPQKKKLAEQIIDARQSGEPVETTLKTDDRVIARVTDGIYRQPGSALRELISNAYDADASEIFIDTDAPRFGTIKITDDGVGMSPTVLARLLEHIGGSSKRTAEGSEIGVASDDDPTVSHNKKRKLIGKIGIGLFSVSQLTQRFQIITKVAGDDYRTVASVVMKTYTEDDLKTLQDGAQFESGKVTIWSEPAEDKDAHGTTIILNDLKPQAKDTLRSKDIWATVHESNSEEDGLGVIAPPSYHIGHVDPETGEQIVDTAVLPWKHDDEPDIKFKKLVDCVWAQIGQSNPNAKLSDLFDSYLHMVWNLGLAAPVPYVEENLFDVTFDHDIESYSISNSQKKGAAQAVPVSQGTTLREVFSLRENSGTADTFDVYLDGIKLAHPLKFKNLPTTAHALKEPLYFVGKCLQPFNSISKEISGGPLEFEAYLFWTPKIAPREHRGSLIRINGASGTLFDSTFMRYQTAEINRLSQITCEIFVHQGLDGALNIDRESFNFAHPHYVFLARWLHSALKQVANTQKKIAGSYRNTTIIKRTDDAIGRLQTLVEKEWEVVGNDPDESPPPVLFQPTAKDLLTPEPQQGAYVFDRDSIFIQTEKRSSSTSNSANKVFEEKLKSIAQLLAAYGVFDNMSKKKQERLLKSIGEIMALEVQE